MRCKTTGNKETGRLADKASIVFFYKKYLKNVKYSVPKDMYFSFNFA